MEIQNIVETISFYFSRKRCPIQDVLSWFYLIVKRIVSNIFTPDLKAAEIFYKQILGLELLMNHDWIHMYGSPDLMALQINFAMEGGSGTAVPDLSIEVDNVDEALEFFIREGFKIEFGPSDEPWGSFQPCAIISIV